jgi:putative sigma-54 modulation protein
MPFSFRDTKFTVFSWKQLNVPVTSYQAFILNHAALYIIVSFKIGKIMNVHIQAVHFDADSKLVDTIHQKIAKLNQFHDRIIKVDVFLKLDNVVHNIKDKIAEIRVHVPKADFFVKASSKSFEASFEEALEAVINQIKRKKEKQAA